MTRYDVLTYFFTTMLKLLFHSNVSCKWINVQDRMPQHLHLRFQVFPFVSPFSFTDFLLSTSTASCLNYLLIHSYLSEQSRALKQCHPNELYCRSLIQFHLNVNLFSRILYCISGRIKFNPETIATSSAALVDVACLLVISSRFFFLL